LVDNLTLAIESDKVTLSSDASALINEIQNYKEEHVGTSQAVDHCCD